MAVANDDRHGTKTTEDFFEIHISNLHFLNPTDGSGRLLPGQRVIVRFNDAAKAFGPAGMDRTPATYPKGVFRR